MSRVFVVQDVKRVSYRTGGLESKYDLTRAKRFGELIYLVEGQVRTFSQSSVGDAYAQVLSGLVDFKEEDYLLLVGDPVLIGIACGVAMRSVSKLKLLQWDKRRYDYEVVEISSESVSEWASVWQT